MKVLGLGSHSGSMTFPMSYDSQGEFYDYSLNRKGWKGLTSLEKSLSVSLGVVSTLAIALMIAVIVVGVQLNDENNCNLVSTPPTPCPTLPSTTPKDDRCDLDRPRPPRRTTTPSSFGVITPPISSSSSSSCIVSSELHNNSTICLTPSCFRTAGKLIESIDFFQDPCENFYQFACGGKSKNSPFPSELDQSRMTYKNLLWRVKEILETDKSHQNSSQNSKSFSLAQQFYHSCMHPLLDDEVVLAEMRVLLDTMTSAPSAPASLDTPPSENSRKMRNVALILANIRRFLNGNFIVDVQIEPDDKNTEENAVYLTHPEFGLPSILKELDIIDPFEEDESDVKGGIIMQSQQNRKKTLRLYQAFVKKLWSMVYPEDGGNLGEYFRQMEEFEEKLKKISKEDGANQENPEFLYNLLSEMENKQELNSTMVGWLTEFTENVIRKQGFEGEGVGKTNEQQLGKEKMPKIVVKNINYFRNLEKILEETGGEIIGKYLKLRILLTYGPHSGDIFFELFSEFKRKVEGPENHVVIPRWQTCADETNKLFGWAISHKLFIQSPLSSNIQQKLNETAFNIKESLNESLSIGLYSWISTNETRTKAQKKLEMLQTFLGFPSDWTSTENDGISNLTSLTNNNSRDDFVEDFYSDLNFTDALNYLQNYVEMRLWFSRKQLEQINQPAFISENFFDFTGWPKFDYPSSSKAYYSEKLNYLALPVGVIDTSLFQPNILINSSTDSPSIQYGSFGVLIAQLMLQAIDEQGSYRSISGNIAPWWDPETRETFQNLSSCFQDQFNDIFGTENDQIPEETSVGVSEKYKNKIIRQLILQNGALALSYQAYHLKTFEQEFDEYLLPGLEDYSPEQLFFLSFAQSQCSSSSSSSRKFIVENSIENSVEFAKHWNCPLPDQQSSCRIF